MSVIGVPSAQHPRRSFPPQPHERDVTDPQGAVIQTSKVMVTNQATGISREAATGAEGFYNNHNLSGLPTRVRRTRRDLRHASFKDVSVRSGASRTYGYCSGSRKPW